MIVFLLFILFLYLRMSCTSFKLFSWEVAVINKLILLLCWKFLLFFSDRQRFITSDYAVIQIGNHIPDMCNCQLTPWFYYEKNKHSELHNHSQSQKFDNRSNNTDQVTRFWVLTHEFSHIELYDNSFWRFFT